MVGKRSSRPIMSRNCPFPHPPRLLQQATPQSPFISLSNLLMLALLLHRLSSPLQLLRVLLVCNLSIKRRRNQSMEALRTRYVLASTRLRLILTVSHCNQMANSAAGGGVFQICSLPGQSLILMTMFPSASWLWCRFVVFILQTLAS